MSQEEEEEQNGKGFVVIDRRGEEDEEEEREATERPPPSPAAEGASAHTEEKIGEIDFATLVHSFAISALYHIGAAPPSPEAPEQAPEINLPVAKQNIDILEVLQEKTQGNLSEEERTLLEGVLYEVRMRFVEATKNT